jgi:hypothetical protein
MLLEIEGKRYPVVTPSDATLSDLLAIKRETGLSVTEVHEMSEVFDGLKGKALEAAIESHLDEFLWLQALTVWLSRKKAGDDVSFEEACDVPYESIREIPEPGDHAVSNKATAKRAVKKATKKASPDSTDPQ